MPTTPLEWPWAVSITIASTPASTSASTRSIESAVTPTPAATRRRPRESLHAKGLSLALVMSLYVTSPTRCPSLSTTGSFSILCCCRICAASSRLVDWLVVTSPSDVITSSMARCGSRSKRRSRLVTMPTSLRSSSTTGMPPMWYSSIILSASATVLPRRMVTGS